MTTAKHTNDTRKAGTGLVEALKEACDAAGTPISHLAVKLGIVKTYWRAILSGHKSIQPLVQKKETCDVFAEVLGLPRISVMSLAEVVQPEDFVFEQSLDDQLNSVYMQLSTDPMWSSLVPKPRAWDEADRGMKLLVVTMYQSALRNSMLKKANLTSEGLARFVRIDARDGLAPAVDQVGKWGQALRPERISASM